MAKKKFATPSRFGSYSRNHFTVIGTIAVSLFIIGVFSLLAVYAGQLVNILENSITIQVFVAKDITPTDSLQLRQTLLQQPFVVTANGEVQYEYITKEAAARQLIAETGEDFIQLLGTNPLKDSYVFKVSPAYQPINKLKEIQEQLKALQGVAEVVYTETFIQQIQANIEKLTALIALLVFISIVIVSILISNAIRLALYAQRFLIRSMQLVGATALFIKKPFLGQSIKQGLIGGMLACVLLSIALIYANLQIPELKLVEDVVSTIAVFCSLIIGGIVICFLSAYFAMNKYLRMSLDELY